MATIHSSSRLTNPEYQHADPEKTVPATEEHKSLDKYDETTSEDAQDENPLAQFSKDEIKWAWRKVDMHVLPVAVLLYLSSYIDRANIGNARVLGLAAALNLSSNQYNLAVSIFFVGYVVFETPSNIIIKRTSPRWYIPVMTIIWGVICCLTSLVKSSAGLSTARFFLGLAEAGFLPGIVFWSKDLA
ncbi:uncharacterized protein PHACADRAFT_129318, partial [Phanerochaete carnosa HHB-10118-sp]